MSARRVPRAVRLLRGEQVRAHRRTAATSNPHYTHTERRALPCSGRSWKIQVIFKLLTILFESEHFSQEPRRGRNQLKIKVEVESIVGQGLFVP